MKTPVLLSTLKWTNSQIIKILSWDNDAKINDREGGRAEAKQGKEWLMATKLQQM